MLTLFEVIEVLCIDCPGVEKRGVKTGFPSQHDIEPQLISTESGTSHNAMAIQEL